MPTKKRIRAGTAGKELMMLLHEPALLAVIIIILLTLGLFVLYPLFKIVELSFTDDAKMLTLEHLAHALGTRTYRAVFRNSLFLAAVVGLISTFVAYIFAYSTTRLKMPLTRFFNTLIHLPIISPPFILALSVIFLFGRQGMITKGLLGIKTNNVYGFKSLLLIQVISFFPIAYLTLTGILSSIDSSVEDAAMNMGASRWHIFRTVTFPLSMPGVISAFLLTFVASLEDFSNPAVIGGDYSTLSVETYKVITGMYDLHGGAVLSIVLLLPTVCAFMLQRHWLAKKSFVTVTGKPPQRSERQRSGAVIPCFLFCLLVSAFIVLLYGTVLYGSVMKTWGIKHIFTLEHYGFAWLFGGAAVVQSLKLSVVAAPLSGVLGIAIAYLTTRRRFPGRRVMQLSSLLTFAIPGTVLGIGYICAFNSGFIVLTGTAAIIVAAFVFRNMSVTIESGSSTLLQIDRSIEEASTILGAGHGTTFRRITLPLLKQPFFSGLVYSFVKSMTAVSTVIFLTSPKWPLATSKVFSLFEISKYSDAAALVMIMIAIILTVIGIMNLAVSLILRPRVRKFE